MGILPLSTVLRAAVMAGLAAGLTVAVFHLVATEPVIDQAVALEEQLSGSGGDHEEPVVSRRAQRVGLVIGFLLYGLTWALPFGVIYQLGQRWLPSLTRLKQALLLALLGYWSVGLLPFLKYPANPPGVGDPETIGYRQALYLGRLTSTPSWPLLLTVALLGVVSATIYVVMPSSPDEVRMPTDLLVTFRALSAIGLTLFWAVLGFLFGKLLSKAHTLVT